MTGHRAPIDAAQSAAAHPARDGSASTNGSSRDREAILATNGNGVPHSSNGRTPAAPDGSRLASALHRTFDITVAGGLLIVLSPLLVAIAAAVRLDSRGPALFRQRRVGHRMNLFTFYKFRTMDRAADPEPHREYVRQLIAGEANSHNGLYKLAVDERVTRVGRVLRKLSLDELPQLWNVLTGDMTLVGPRPVIPYEVELYPDWYCGRFAVKPGLTGLWQVSGRNERSYDEMIRLDIEFVSRHSFRRDLLILAKTPWVVLRRRGVA